MALKIFDALCVDFFHLAARVIWSGAGSRQSEAVAVGLLEEDTWGRLGAGHRMLLDQEHLSLLCWFSRDSEQGRYFPHFDHELGEAGLDCTRLWDCP